MMSRLPDDPAYWDKLTDRLVASAAGQLQAYQIARSGRWRTLARLSMPLAIGAAAAVLIALLRLPGKGPDSVEDSAAARVYPFSPSDPLAALLVTSASAPTMATLLSTPSSERIQ